MAPRVAALVALILVAGSEANHYNSSCGHSCTQKSDCVAGCSVCNGEYCVPACGHKCKVNEDCGIDTIRPETPCTICIDGHCHGQFQYGKTHLIKTSLPPGGVPPKPGHPTEPPILASAWNATITFHNYTDGGKAGYGRSWYDFAYGAARFDYPAPCPFIQAAKYEINQGPCSVIFYKGNNYYVYPDGGTCCQYKFPVWGPDCFRKSNATYIGTYEMPLGTADIWDSSYATPWREGYEPTRISPQFPLSTGATVQRRIFTTREGVPLAINETNTATVNIFTKVEVGPQKESIFTELLNGCHNTSIRPEGVKYCMWYPSSGRLAYWGYD